MKNRKPKVVWKKLGQFRAWGMAEHDPARPRIYCDPRLSPRRTLEVLIHEQLHLSLPDLSEAKIDKLGKEVARTLWEQNYRQVNLGRHTTPVKITK